MKNYSSMAEQTPELEAQRLISKKRSLDIDQIDKISDSDWLKQSFLINSGAVTEEEKINRVFTTAIFKFQDSSIGGNYVINPKAQFTRYADAPVKGKLLFRGDTTVNGANANIGIGHYYSEAIDDTGQVIHMRFGVPQFNSLTTFFSGFFDTRAANAARTGRLDAGFFSTLGSIAGFSLYLLTWPLVLASFVGNGIRFAMNKPSSSFYYFKPTMPSYWLSVNNMVNQIAMNKGLFPAEVSANNSQFAGGPYKINETMMAKLSEMMPDVFSARGGIDVFGISARGQRMKNILDKTLNETMNTSDTVEGFVQKFNGEVPNVAPGDRGFIGNLINKWLGTEIGKRDPAEGAVDFERSLKVTQDDKPAAYSPTIGDYFKAEYDDGGAFVSLRVNSTGPVSESFSNTVVESDLASKFNSMSGANKSAYFSFAGGNVVGGAIGAVMGGVAGAVKDFVAGGLNAFNVGGLLALGGSAFVNIPKHWENSQTSLPKASYTISLVSPYGNAISQMTSMYIPLCMILAGCLPQATGKQSYTSPFLVQLYDRGRQQTRLGMIDSVSITRGTTNLGFNKEGAAMGIDVTFSVVDLSSVVAMPTSAKSFLQEVIPTDGVLDDDNTYTDYLNVLSSLSLYDQYYTTAKLKLRIAERVRRYEMLFNKARFAMFVRDNISVVDIFFKGAQRDNGGTQRSGLFGDRSPF